MPKFGGNGNAVSRGIGGHGNSEDTAVPFPYLAEIIVGTRHCRLLISVSRGMGGHGNSEDTAVPFPY